MNYHSKNDKGYIAFLFSWTTESGWNHYEALAFPNYATYKEFEDGSVDDWYEDFEEDVDAWFGQGAPYKDFESKIENLCLEDPDYRDRMIQELDGYEARGHVTWEYDDMLDCKFWEIIRPTLWAAFNMGVGESVSSPYIPLNIMRVK